MVISVRLQKAMNMAGFGTQAALAEASGVPQPTINRILKGVGKRGPETSTVMRLAVACGVPFDWLLVEGAPQPPLPMLKLASERGRCDAGVAHSDQRFHLIHVSDREIELISAYNSADEVGRAEFDLVIKGVKARIGKLRKGELDGTKKV